MIYNRTEVHICEFGRKSAWHISCADRRQSVTQWFPVLQEALDKPDWCVLVTIKSTPMMEALVFYARMGRKYSECAKWCYGSLLKITQTAPSFLLLGSARASFTSEQVEQDGRMVFRNDQHLTGSLAASLAAPMAEPLQQGISRRRKGNHVIGREVR